LPAALLSNGDEATCRENATRLEMYWCKKFNKYNIQYNVTTHDYFTFLLYHDDELLCLNPIPE